MKTEFRKSFERDLKKLRKDREILDRVREVIEAVEEAIDLQALPNLKKLTEGTGEFFRLRVGDYRVGLEVEGETVIFVRCLHRRDVYRYFP